MNKRGFTLVELLATIVVLSIVVGLTVTGIAFSIKNAKKKTEEVYIGTLKDAIKIYLDDDENISKLRWNASLGTFPKTNGSAEFLEASEGISFDDIINSTYSPIIKKDLLNPATEKICDPTKKIIHIFRDTDEVYYYYIDKSLLKDEDGYTDCLVDTSGSISNLPDEVIAVIN